MLIKLKENSQMMKLIGHLIKKKNISLNLIKISIIQIIIFNQIFFVFESKIKFNYQFKVIKWKI